MSLCALNLSGTQATRAYIYTLGTTVHNCLYPTDVGLPGSVGLTVGVGNGITKSHALTANFTLCHLEHLLKHSHLTMPCLYKNF